MITGKQPKPATHAALVSPEFSEKKGKENRAEKVGPWRGSGSDGPNRKQRQDCAADVSPPNEVSHDRQASQRAKPTQPSIPK